jgi:hypothetical protein
MTKIRKKISSGKNSKKSIQSFGTLEISNFEFVSDFGFQVSNFLIGLITVQKQYLPNFDGTVQKRGDLR